MIDIEAGAGPRDVWMWALSWLRKPPSSPDKRARQSALVAAYVAELRSVGTIAGLHARYCGDSRWALRLARERFPREWPTLGVHATTAAAFGVRYVEMMVGREIDVTEPLPAWVGEWAIW